MRLRGLLIHEPDEPALAARPPAHRRIVNSGTVPFGPISEDLAQEGHHVGFLKIAGHAEDDPVGMNRVVMEGHEIVTGDASDRTQRGLPGTRMVGP